MICILQLVSTSSSSTSNSVNQLISMTKRDVTVENLQNKLKRMQTIQENDIVFLVDGSGSVLYENFKFELIFVRKVLNAFNVNLNFTRVAVVPFSTPNVKVRIKKGVIYKTDIYYANVNSNTEILLQLSTENITYRNNTYY